MVKTRSIEIYRQNIIYFILLFLFVRTKCSMYESRFFSNYTKINTINSVNYTEVNTNEYIRSGEGNIDIMYIPTGSTIIDESIAHHNTFSILISNGTIIYSCISNQYNINCNYLNVMY